MCVGTEQSQGAGDGKRERLEAAVEAEPPSAVLATLLSFWWETAKLTKSPLTSN